MARKLASSPMNLLGPGSLALCLALCRAQEEDGFHPDSQSLGGWA